MTKDQVLCVSYFDQVIGPNIFYCNSDEFDSDDLSKPDLGRILEFNEEPGTFIFAFRKYQTINHIFYINSSFSRGGKELLMVSFLIRAAYFKKEIPDVFEYLQSKEPILDDFANQIKELEELPRVLHGSKSNLPKNRIYKKGTPQFQKKFLSLFNSYLDKLTVPLFPEKTTGRVKKKIFIFGSPKSGKSTFLKNIESIQFYNQKNEDLPSLIYEMLIDNMEILTFDCIGEDRVCETCQNYEHCVEMANGYFILFDLADENSFKEALRRFNSIVEACKENEGKIENVPVIIIGNNYQSDRHLKRAEVVKVFEIDGLEECGMKVQYFEMNVVRDADKIMKAMKWFVRHLV